MEAYEDILTKLDASQLLKLREKLLSLKFVSASDLVFGCFRKHYYSGTCSWSDGTGYSIVDRYSYSEIILYNKITERDALTGENLDESYHTFIEGVGPMGERYTFLPCPVSRTSEMREMTLKEEAIRYQLPRQDLYSDYDILKLLRLYNDWYRFKINEIPFSVTSQKEKILLPIRQYEEGDHGKVLALKPLQYF